MSDRYVAYYRVSTVKQGRSGLGLEAQEEAVMHYIQQQDGEILASFTEVESGKRNDRPELAKALRHCRLTNSVLVIAKLDRLARNLAFIANLMEAGVRFVACDFPVANELTVHIMASFAQFEAKVISARTKAALAAAKARKVKLGNPNGAIYFKDKPGHALGGAAMRAKALAKDADVADAITAFYAETGSSAKTADKLNEIKISAPRGGKWHATTVLAVLRRLGVETKTYNKKSPVVT